MKKINLTRIFIIPIFLICTLATFSVFAQIAKNLRNEKWIEAGGNSLVTTYFSPKFVNQNDGLTSLIVKWNYKKPVNNINSSVSIIKINCQNLEYAVEYSEIYSELNLAGKFIDGGNFPSPLQWNNPGDSNAYAELIKIICK